MAPSVLSWNHIVYAYLFIIILLLYVIIIIIYIYIYIYMYRLLIYNLTLVCNHYTTYYYVKNSNF